MPTPRARLARPESLHQQVARNIRNDIESGALRNGEVLPSTRELASRWDVSVFTITEAMKLLAEEGLVINKSRSKRLVHFPGPVNATPVRPAQPFVILIGGYAGSGKTELGRILARETGWSILDKDTLTRPVVEAALEILGQSPNDRESDTYLKYVRPREYESLAAAADENVLCGNSVIVTAPFIKEFSDSAWIERHQASYEARNVRVALVWVYCDAPTMNTYIRHRGAARDAFKLSDWPGYIDSIDEEFRPSAPHYVVDNRPSSAPLQTQAQDLLKRVLDQ